MTFNSLSPLVVPDRTGEDARDADDCEDDGAEPEKQRILDRGRKVRVARNDVETRRTKHRSAFVVALVAACMSLVAVLGMATSLRWVSASRGGKAGDDDKKASLRNGLTRFEVPERSIQVPCGQPGCDCDCEWAGVDVCANQRGHGRCFDSCCGGVGKTNRTCHSFGGCTCDCSWASKGSCNRDDGGCCFACCCGASYRGTGAPQDLKCVDAASTEDANIQVGQAYRGSGSLYCFSLMLPTGYERDLVALQFDRHTSIFACDDATVYSSQAIDVAQGLRSRVVSSDLKCAVGGEFRTALNNDIFLVVWSQVINDGFFMAHEWTVKVDPDTVFMPWRLRDILHQHPAGPKGVYINNCKYGLHGPLEVLSTAAVVAWGGGKEQCVKHFKKVCNGDCWWGEDMWLDQCMCKVLGIKRENEFLLLSEEHCDPPAQWRSCEDVARIAFHPFKNVGSYSSCIDAANRVRPPPITRTSTSTGTSTTSSSTVTSTTTVSSTTTTTASSSTTTFTTTSSTSKTFTTTVTTTTSTLTVTRTTTSSTIFTSTTFTDTTISKLDVDFHVSFDCFTRYTYWEFEWSNLKRHWCCKHKGTGCPPRKQPGAAERNCTGTEENINYWTGRLLYRMDYVMSAASCRARCRSDSQCGAWTWGQVHGEPSVTNVCTLKQVADGERPRRVWQFGVVSGLPCSILPPDTSDSEERFLIGSQPHTAISSVGGNSVEADTPRVAQPPHEPPQQRGVPPQVQ